MVQFLARKIARRNPFRPVRVPWLARLYAYPFERWNSLGKQALFGAPNFLLFHAYQKFGPIKPEGLFTYTLNGEQRSIRFDGRNTQFCALYRKAFAQGYEPQVAALVDVLISEDSVVYDVGSNWGWLSLLVASKPGFRGAIHAFEPFPSTFRDLTSVVAQAGLQSVVRCHELALSDRLGEGRMQLPDRFQSGQAVLTDNPGGGGAAIPTGTLDSLNLPKPTFIKIDVEGAEARVIAGGRKVFSEAKPMVIFESGRCEDTPERTLEPLYLMRDLGYHFFHLGWQRQLGNQTFLMGDDTDTNPKAEETLILHPFSAEERFLKSGGMNIFACHIDRVGEIERLFERRQLG